MIGRVIFGCHNLTGGSSYLYSKRLVDAAFDLGIRRFDVAPSYGLGTAEATLARALGRRKNWPDVEITTKFGIEPPRLGYLTALVREPYRLAGRLVRSDDLRQRVKVGRNNQGGRRDSDAEYPFTATEAALKSVRALGLEQIRAFLVHERLPERLSQRLHSDVIELKARGIIRRAGVSGSLGNVLEMAAALGTSDIVQVAIDHAQTAPACAELRVFNLARLLRDRSSSTPGSSDLGVSSESMFGRELAAAAHTFLRKYPQASVIFNTSSPRRLEIFVKALDAVRD